MKNKFFLFALAPLVITSLISCSSNKAYSTTGNIVSEVDIDSTMFKDGDRKNVTNQDYDLILSFQILAPQ